MNDDGSHELADLTAAVRELKRLDREAGVILGRLDRARGQVVDIVGGDKLAAISNGERRIGELVTNDATSRRD